MGQPQRILTDKLELRLPAELRRKIDAAAAADRRPPSQLVRNVLEDFFEERARPRAVEAQFVNRQRYCGGCTHGAGTRRVEQRKSSRAEAEHIHRRHCDYVRRRCTAIAGCTSPLLAKASLNAAWFGRFWGRSGHCGTVSNRSLVTQSDTSQTPIIAFRNWWVEASLLAHAHSRRVTFENGFKMSATSPSPEWRSGSGPP
jgi:hypothetical protein